MKPLNYAEIAVKIKFHREALGYSYQDLADLTGMSKSTLQRYETGSIKNIPITRLKVLSEALKCDPRQLMGIQKDDDAELDLSKFSNIYPLETRKFPLLGKIACGEPIFAEEDHETYVEADSSIRADFCLRAEGDSMINARIQDGDIVFIRKQEMVENGEIAAVIIEDEATLKRVYYDRKGNKLVLNAENPNYRPLVYIGQELEQIRILGKAVAFMSYID